MCGMDVSITTNGVLFNPDLAESCLPYLSWIRFSLDAARKETYMAVHGSNENGWFDVISNIKHAVAQRDRNKWTVTIGVQFLIIPENQDEILEAISLCKDLGVDYISFKPFSQHPMMIRKIEMDYASIRKMELPETERPQIIFRDHTMEKLGEDDRMYQRCHGLPFWAYLAANGDLCACSAFLGNDAFVYGNLSELRFPEIWHSERRRGVMKRVAEMNIDGCRDVCRLDEINRYLWALKHPEVIPHVNFI